MEPREFIYRGVTGQLDEGTIKNRYSFLLKSFGLENVRAALYKPGTKADSRESSLAVAAGVKPIADLEYNMTTKESGKAVISPLGTPVFSDVILKSGNTELQLLWVMAEVSMSKNIVKTAIQGRDGTVKEYISDGDYQVKLMGGFASSFSRAYPKEEVNSLLQLCKKKETLVVISEYLLLFDIHNLVIEDYTLKQVEGKQNIQLFELNCVSDDPLILQRKKDV